MAEDLQRPTGTLDVLPEEGAWREYVVDAFQDHAKRYGYQRVDVPILEKTELFERGVGQGTDIAEKEMYTFQDKGGETLSLRPELTAGIVRSYLQNGLHGGPQPVLFYAVGPLFRYERPQAGRYRQHTQLDVEILGDGDPSVDVEVIQFAWSFFQRIGLDGISLQLNSTGCSACRPVYVRALREYYKEGGRLGCEDCQRRVEVNPLRMLDCKKESCQEAMEAAPRITDRLCPGCAGHLNRVKDGLNALSIHPSMNSRLVRGLDYYTRTVFEIWAPGIGAQSAIAGGGRYDGLCEILGGPPRHGMGFGSGLERLVMTLQEQAYVSVRPPCPMVYVVAMGEAASEEATILCAEIRKAGIRTRRTFTPRGIKAQMKAADRSGARVVLLLGEEELASKSVTVRFMDQSEQERVALAHIVDRLRRLG